MIDGGKVSLHDDLEETIAGGVIKPGVVVGAPHAGVKVQSLTRQLFGGQFALGGCHASGFELRGAPLLPGFEGPGLFNVPGVLNPLDDLRHGHEVDVVVSFEDLIDPVEEGVEERRVVLEPGGVEEETKGSPVLIVMAVEVVSEEVVELVSTEDVGAGVHHGTAGQVFVNGGIFTAIKLIHDHFPDGVGSGGAFLEITMASVGHSEVHGVRPERRVLKGSSDGGVIQESLFFHHGELVVATDTEVRSTKTHNRVVGDVGKLVNDEPGSSHLLGPVVNRG